MPAIVPEDQLTAAQRVRRLAATYREHEDLISIGAYKPGTNPLVDEAVATRELIRDFSAQRTDERSRIDTARAALLQLTSSSTPQSLLSHGP
jgi:flagellar biosynthesis/type III secretory pathway ATPase